MIKITVPATSANLGIGYDTLGMAVSLYSHFTFERADKLTITGCPEEFQNENNLVYVSFVDALAAWDEPALPVAIDIQTDVPVARGLGSSSTCVVAGIMAAAALTGHTVDRAELVRIATEVEGHPDNVAPAILGGAVCSFTPTDSLPQCLRYEVSDKLRFITVIPPYEVHTSEARKVVPQEIPLSTAVWQMGRIAGMTRGLETGDLDLIAAANDDRIQEPYRRRLIPDYNAVRDTCLNGGAKTIWISGSGSTLMAVTDDTIVAKFLQVRLRELGWLEMETATGVYDAATTAAVYEFQRYVNEINNSQILPETGLADASTLDWLLNDITRPATSTPEPTEAPVETPAGAPVQTSPTSEESAPLTQPVQPAPRVAPSRIKSTMGKHS